jgi:hypothetical protein
MLGLFWVQVVENELENALDNESKHFSELIKSSLMQIELAELFGSVSEHKQVVPFTKASVHSTPEDCLTI